MVIGLFRLALLGLSLLAMLAPAAAPHARWAGNIGTQTALGIVFLVLLALEFTGTIDIFKKVP